MHLKIGIKIKGVFFILLLGVMGNSYSKDIFISKLGLTLTIPDDWIEMPQEGIDWLNEQSLNQDSFVGGFCHRGCTHPMDEPNIIIDHFSIIDLASFNSMKDLLVSISNKFFFEDPIDLEIDLKGGKAFIEGTILSQPYCDPERNLVYGLIEGESEGMSFRGWTAIRPIESGLMRFYAVLSQDNFKINTETILSIFSTIRIQEEFELDFSRIASGSYNSGIFH